jgi:predicted Fe-S protein YdhL (DUF1289 family)
MSVPSPCTSVCRINAATGLCEGCFRTLAEITDWSRADDADKREILRRVAERRQAADWFDDDQRCDCDR